jgi:hypothetical protein
MRCARCIGGFFIAAAILSAPQAEAQVSYSGEGECNKGLFWPFVRNPGDCLTDTERRSGMTGTYRGSEVEEADEAAEAATPAPAQAQQSAPPSASPAPTAPNPPQNVASPAGAAPEPASPAAGAAAVQPAAAQRAAPVGSPAVEEPAAEDDRTTYTGAGGCTKGVFWPFVRRAGDCLTDSEIRSGRTGTYR